MVRVPEWWIWVTAYALALCLMITECLPDRIISLASKQVPHPTANIDGDAPLFLCILRMGTLLNAKEIRLNERLKSDE
jgi:hypothetical protein